MALIDDAVAGLKGAFGGREVTIKADSSNYPINKPDAATQTVEAFIPVDTSNQAEVKALMQQSAATLADSESLREIAAVQTPEQRQASYKQELSWAAEKGLLPKNSAEWKGVDPAIGPANIMAHALHIDHSDETGTHVLIRIAKVAGQDNSATLQKLVQNLESHKEVISTTLVERTAKNVPLTDEEKAALKTIPIKITTNEDEKTSDIYIAIRHPLQDDVKNGKTTDEAGIAKAKAANPLNKLNDEQRGKVLGHAILMENKQIVPEFVPYLGTKDMDALLRRAENHYKKQNPTPDQEILDRLAKMRKNDLLHDRHTWNLPGSQRPVELVTPYIGTDNDHPGKLLVRIAVPYGKRDDALKALAALKPLEAAKAAETPTTEPAKEIAAAAGTIAMCPEGIAVAGAGAATDANGNAIAGSGGACINPKTNEVTAAGALAAQTPEVQAAVAGAVQAKLDPEVAAVIQQAMEAAQAPQPQVVEQKPPVTVGSTVIEPKPTASAITPKMAESFLKGLASGKISLSGPTV